MLFVTFARFLFGIHCGIVSLVVLFGGPVFYYSRKSSSRDPSVWKKLNTERLRIPMRQPEVPIEEISWLNLLFCIHFWCFITLAVSDEDDRCVYSMYVCGGFGVGSGWSEVKELQWSQNCLQFQRFQRQRCSQQRSAGSPSEGVSSRFLLLYSGDGGEVESAKPRRPESSRSPAQLQPAEHLHPETPSLWPSVQLHTHMQIEMLRLLFALKYCGLISCWATVSLIDTPGCWIHRLCIHFSTCPSTSLPHTHIHTHTYSPLKQTTHICKGLVSSVQCMWQWISGWERGIRFPWCGAEGSMGTCIDSADSFRRGKPHRRSAGYHTHAHTNTSAS